MRREERLVAAEHDLRREIERRLHDGPQQALVALAVELQLAERLVPPDGVELRSLLAELREHVHEALDAVRELASHVYPSLLLDAGIVDALRPIARVRATGVGRHAREIEAAVYFFCAEMVAVAAAPVEVVVREHEDALAFDVRADALDVPLQVQRSASDRIAVLGGAVTFTPGAACGVIQLRP